MAALNQKKINREHFLNRVLQVNSRATLRILEGRHAGSYTVRVEDIYSDSVMLSGPFYKNLPVMLETGAAIAVDMLSESGVYEFEGWVQNIERTPIYTFTASVPPGESISLNQRRAFVRLECRIPLQYQRMIQRAGEDAVPGKKHKVETYNISGGGICLLLEEPLEVGVQLDLELSLLPDKPPLMILGEVVRTRRLPADQGPKQFEIGIAYIQIRQIDQDRIVKFVFEQERKTVRQR